MKRPYTIPLITIAETSMEFILAGSDVSGGVTGYVDNNEEIGNGGIDHDGGLIPAVNRSLWDEEI